MKTLECEDRPSIFEYDLDKLSAESLKALLSIYESCTDCDGCAAQIGTLQNLLTERTQMIQKTLF